MATDEALTTAFRLLIRAYPDHVKRHLSDRDAVPEMQRLYARFLEDVEDALLLAVVEAHVATDIWWPKPASLRKMMVELLVLRAGLPTPYEAWAEVLWRAKRWNPTCYFGDDKEVWQTKQTKLRTWTTPLIGKALDGVGGMDQFNERGEGGFESWRVQFYKSYEALLEKAVQHQRLPASVHRRLESLPSPQIGGGNGQGRTRNGLQRLDFGGSKPLALEGSDG